VYTCIQFRKATLTPLTTWTRIALTLTLSIVCFISILCNILFQLVPVSDCFGPVLGRLNIFKIFPGAVAPQPMPYRFALGPPETGGSLKRLKRAKRLKTTLLFGPLFNGKNR